MRAGDTFDEWARQGKDQGMEERHWHTARHALSQMPVEPGDTVLDLGSGSGYAGRALLAAMKRVNGRRTSERAGPVSRDTADTGRTYGIDAAAEMVDNARSYTEDRNSGFLRGDFEHLPFADDSVDHCFSMEAFYYAEDPHAVLAELLRVIRPGGTFYCAVNRWEENVYSHEWEELVGVPMVLWSERQYREAFREAGFHVAGQDRIPDEETEIPPESAFPTEDWETREAMVERYREYGTLLTVGVVP